MVGGSLLISNTTPVAHATGSESVLEAVRRLPSPSPGLMAILADFFAPAGVPGDRVDFLADDRRFASAYLDYLADPDFPAAGRPEARIPATATTSDILGVLSAVTPGRPTIGIDAFALACGTIADFAYRLPATSTPVRGGAFSLSTFWRHSLAVAALAREFVSPASVKEPAEAADARRAAAFACGLWHDVGRLILAHLYPRGYARILDQLARSGSTLCAAERGMLGVDHTLVGRRATGAWGCPDAVVRSAWLHHGGWGGQAGDRLAAVIELADAVATRASDAARPDRTVDTSRLAEMAGLSPDHVEEACLDWIGDSRRAADAIVRRLGLEPGEDRSAVERGSSGPVGERWLAARASVAASRIAAAAAAWDGALSRLPNSTGAAAVAAEALAGLLGVAEALVLLPGGGGSTWHAVAWGEDQPADAAPRVERVAAPEFARAMSNPLMQGLFGAIGDEHVARCWRKSFGSLPERGLAALPLACRAGLQGVCVVPAAAVEQAARDLEEGPLRALCQSMATGLSNVASRCDADQLAERLADSCRRMGEELPHRVRARTVAALAATAAGAAHELNNPLAVISGRAQLLLAGGADAEVARHVRIIKEQTDRAASMALDLMTYAKPPSPSRAIVAVGPLVEAACQHCRERFGLRQGQIDVHLADPALAAGIDAEHLRRIINELLANAAAALSPEGGRIVINSTARASDDTVRIVVEDDGSGMSPEVLEHAFDPFYSHRPAGRGRGMGLSIASRLAEAGGGRITLQSSAGEGTVAVIELPSEPACISLRP